MIFSPYGSFVIPKQEKGLISTDRDELKKFWKNVEEEAEGLSSAIGIYIFSIRAGKGMRPWYVGKTENAGFFKECFQPHKINHYNYCIAKRKGTPLLTFIPKLTQADNLAQPNGRPQKDISSLEKMLIGACLQKNKDLVNARDTKIFRDMVVHGYLNNPQGGVKNSVKEFKKLIG
ncbi:MAG: hypothetical protein KUA37_11970 [Desulfomicrobium sp.]|jgi:hypothetical protein|nr:hypothetical protein [Desulfomicrobium sp.]MBV1719428.1 hypothetical protein [Desulfomicrobium sp.]MBV1746534.1 hypothetical protein [Desulfomicrobium sp.]